MNNNNDNILSLEEILELCTPFEGYSSKEELYEIIERFPIFRDQFCEQITKAFSDQVRENGIYCIVNNVSWKHPKTKKALYLGYLGYDRHPKISIYF